MVYGRLICLTNLVTWVPKEENYLDLNQMMNYSILLKTLRQRIKSHELQGFGAWSVYKSGKLRGLYG